MFRRQVRRVALAMLVAVLAAAGMQLATGAPAAAVRTVYYDASRTGEFRTNFDQAAQIWNSRVSNVRLLSGTPASITIYVDDGWPRAQPTGLGSGRIWMGRTAVNQGYDRTRIATHEVGHILGLPDRRTGLCTDLMSGSSAPVSCRNANPSAAEASRVNSLFAGTLAAPAGTTYTWNAGSDIGPTVVGGRPATENYPFMVYVSGCTGTLIKANWAVTAKHCSTPSSVRVGSVNRSSGGTVVRVTRAVNHPSVDVKLLQLASSVTYAPAPIPSSSGAVGTATRIIGWGQTCAPRGCGSAPAVANELDTSIVADSRCSGINGTYEICTNNTNGNSGACYGDSGGPQVRQVNGVWNVIGATSRAGNNNSTCATGPSIYVDLPSIRSWISTQVGGLPV
ncbi:snapalysin family zinc-dependent metalloprotease [Micromonospora sp. NPDC048835]|uniref:snapalysin family zinc-dependent metalloprotease n=1 Tax=Micromonospora sp. NPDC048835 TaxID=3155147 RepID=UPI00340972A1